MVNWTSLEHINSDKCKAWYVPKRSKTFTPAGVQMLWWIEKGAKQTNNKKQQKTAKQRQGNKEQSQARVALCFMLRKEHKREPEPHPPTSEENHRHRPKQTQKENDQPKPQTQANKGKTPQTRQKNKDKGANKETNKTNKETKRQNNRQEAKRKTSTNKQTQKEQRPEKANRTKNQQERAREKGPISFGEKSSTGRASRCLRRLWFCVSLWQPGIYGADPHSSFCDWAFVGLRRGLVAGRLGLAPYAGEWCANPQSESVWKRQVC